MESSTIGASLVNSKYYPRSIIVLHLHKLVFNLPVVVNVIRNFTQLHKFIFILFSLTKYKNLYSLPFENFIAVLFLIQEKLFFQIKSSKLMTNFMLFLSQSACWEIKS